MKPVLSELRGRESLAHRRDVPQQHRHPAASLGTGLSRFAPRQPAEFLATFDVLGKIVTRRMSARSLSGPIGIAQISGEAYRAGIP